jgi:sugar lactone lactonase YvrE
MKLQPMRLVSGLVFPEGPRWHDGALWFADLQQRTVFRLTPDGGHKPVLSLEDDRPSGMGFMPDGSLLVVAMMRRQLLRWQGGALTVHSDLGSFPADFLNDMVVDDVGRAYVGARSGALSAATHYRDPKGSECLIAVEPDGTASIAADDVLSPNGTVISPDGRSLIVAETYGRRLMHYDRDPRNGRLSGRRLFAGFDRMFADGICLDAEGAIWVGSPYTHEFTRVTPKGEVDAKIVVPGGVACALGGENRKTLFMMAVDPDFLPPGGEPVPAGYDIGAPPRGAIFTAHVPVAGAGKP